MNAAIGFNLKKDQVTININGLVFDCHNTAVKHYKNYTVVAVATHVLRPEVANTLSAIAQAQWGKPVLVETESELFDGSERVLYADVFTVASALLGLVIE